MANPPTPRLQFYEETQVPIFAIIRQALNEFDKPWRPISQADRNWFINHADVRIRYMHANAGAFHFQLCNGDGERAVVVVRRWVTSWANDYASDVAVYKQVHNEEGVPVTQSDETRIIEARKRMPSQASEG